MITVGIDLAAQPAATAACRVSWGSAVEVEDARVGLTDPDLLELIAGADRTGIDVPFGWPLSFVQAISDHMDGKSWPAQKAGKGLTHRGTDRFIYDKTGRWPLSVSADKIAIPAMRAAGLLSRIEPIPDRAGHGPVLEVYPAAALRVWGFDPSRYKGIRGAAVRAALVDSVLTQTQAWVTLSDSARRGFVADDNRFDAFIAALVTRAWETGLCWAVPPDLLRSAETEGWIALPRPGTLGELARAKSLPK